MQTLKTALVVTFLLSVLYVVYTALNKPETASNLPGMAELQEWTGPEVELPEFSSEAPAHDSANTLGEPASGLPPFAATAGSNYPLPEIEAPESPALAAVAEPYSRHVTAPPLPTAPAHDDEHNHAPAAYDDSLEQEHEHASVPESNPAPLAEESASPYAASPYANTRSESVTASEQAPLDEAPGSSYQPNDAASYEPSESEAATRTSLAEYRFKEAWAAAQRELDENKFARALATLTEMYREEDLTAEHRQQLLDMLDRLAGTVIYSTEHRLEPPYEVNRGETLEQIAQRFKVPSELLFNINRSAINEPDLLLPGTQLKVMRGPLRAEITIDRLDPSRGEASLFLGRLYAGRFPVSFGDDMPTLGREYQVTERLTGKPYYQPSGPPVEAGSPTNPYGSYWLGFNDPAVGMHGLSQQGGEDDGRGSIRLADRDAADVFGILSVGSTVKVLP